MSVKYQHLKKNRLEEPVYFITILLYTLISVDIFRMTLRYEILRKPKFLGILMGKEFFTQLRFQTNTSVSRRRAITLIALNCTDYFFFSVVPENVEMILILERPSGIAGRYVSQERSFSLLRSFHRVWFTNKGTYVKSAVVSRPPLLPLALYLAISRSKRKLRNSSAMCALSRRCLSLRYSLAAR